jgi:acyl-coenzyme A thioesterase PaaI-like protein
MDIRTHKKADPDWVGRILETEPGRFARVSLVTRPEMVVDEKGLIHGGFTFGLGDFAAMIAVNEPNVVLTSAQARFLRPVRLGDIMLALARVTENQDRKWTVEVEIRVADHAVFQGTFYCYVPEKHVLDTH